jgi:hypothetical protein
MAVYVDNARNAYRQMLMCHMLADTPEELHAMADKIGIQRKWFQNEKTPHYDICRSKRGLALLYGAIEIDRRQTVEIIKKLRAEGNWK